MRGARGQVDRLLCERFLGLLHVLLPSSWLLHSHLSGVRAGPDGFKLVQRQLMTCFRGRCGFSTELLAATQATQTMNASCKYTRE